MNAPTNWQLWNQLQAAALREQMCAAGRLAREINRVLDTGADSLECREWASLRRQLRQVAPAIAAQLMLQALEKEQEWRDREQAGELDPDWDYETMVGQYRRAAIAAATLKDACHQAAAAPA